MSHRLFIAPERLAPGKLELTGDDYHYLCRVLRLKRGAALTLFDGAGRCARAEIDRVDPGCVAVRVDAPEPAAESAVCELTVLLPIIKGDRTEWAIQKLVELGVSRIAPIRTARGVVKLEGKRAEERVRRYTAVAEAAARQCGRPSVPAIEPIADLVDAVAAVPADALKLMLWERARGESLRRSLPAEAPARCALLVGPEGGFTDEETERAAASGWRPVGFGPRILRSETAAVAAVAVVASAFGNLD